jgi:Tol biopolymer transport system component
MRFVHGPRLLTVAGVTVLLAAMPGPGEAGPRSQLHGGSTSNVYLLNVSSGHIRLLTHNREGDEDALAYSPALSPDGKRLAYAETRCHFCPSMIRIAAAGTAAWLGRVISPGFKPVWTPDGRRLTFVRPDGSIAITTTNLTRPRIFVRGGLANDAPNWDPHAQHLAFARQLTATNWQIFMVRSDGSGLRALTRGPQPALDPAWAPDGRRLAYTRQDKNGRWRICLTSLSDRSSHCVTNSGFSDTQPNWSPDGRWIAFVRQKPFGSAIWIMHPDGSRAHQVAPPWPDALTALQPRWTANPNELLFVGRL